MKYPSYIRLYEASSPLMNWHIQEWNRSNLLRRAAKTFFAGAGGSKYSEIQKLNLGTTVRSMGRAGMRQMMGQGEPGSGLMSCSLS